MSEMTQNSIPTPFLLPTERQRYPIKSAGNIAKPEIIKQLKESILAEDITRSNKIAVDMIISYYFKELWDSFFEIWIEYIHLKKINMLMWLLKNHNLFNSIKSKSKSIINNQEIRNMIAQIVAVLCIQPKLKIEISSNSKSAELSSNSKELAKYYYNDSKLTDGGSDVPLALAQFIEFYNNNALKSAYYWIHQLLISTELLRAYKGFRISKKLSGKPIILVWAIMYAIAEKKSIDTIIINDLRQLFMHFLLQNNINYSLLYTYIMVSYVKYHQKIKFTDIDILDRRVLKAVLCINFCYKSSITSDSEEQEQTQKISPIALDTDIMLINAGKKKPKPVIINTDNKINTLKIKIRTYGNTQDKDKDKD